VAEQGPARAAMPAEELRRIAMEVAAAEVRGIGQLDRLFASPAFAETVRLFDGCRGRILVFGLGKSGLAGQRIAASLRSVGAPSVFIHPVEALHGDLGIVDPHDVALLISKSGQNGEMAALAPVFRRLGVPIVGLTATADSDLGRAADLLLDLGPRSRR
jgi:arabinose-5-phosphate isomerase